MKQNESTTIKSSKEQVKELEDLKIIPQEPLWSVIKRLIDLKKQFDKRVKQ